MSPRCHIVSPVDRDDRGSMNAEDLVIAFKRNMSKLSGTERRRAIESIRNVIRAAMYEDAAGSAYEVEPCPRCGSAATVKKGKAGNGEQRYLCRGCGRTFGMGSERILVQVVQDLHGCRRGRCRAHGRAAVCEREL